MSVDSCYCRFYFIDGVVSVVTANPIYGKKTTYYADLIKYFFFGSLVVLFHQLTFFDKQITVIRLTFIVLPS